MGIYIEGMKMPKSCGYCPLRHEARDGDECYLGASLTEYQKRPDDCPLVPVPEHGNLIDAGKLVELCDIMANKCDGIGVSIWHQFKTTVEWSPIVIKSEEGET